MEECIAAAAAAIPAAEWIRELCGDTESYNNVIKINLNIGNKSYCNILFGGSIPLTDLWHCLPCKYGEDLSICACSCWRWCEVAAAFAAASDKFPYDALEVGLPLARATEFEAAAASNWKDAAAWSGDDCCIILEKSTSGEWYWTWCEGERARLRFALIRPSVKSLDAHIWSLSRFAAAFT